MTGGEGVAAVILAAGGGSRFEPGPDARHKLLVPWRGRPLVWWAVSNAVDAGLGPTWVISGAADLADVLPAGAAVLHNPRWAEGQATSLQVAVAAARDAGFRAIVVGLGDQPLVPVRAWRAVARCSAAIAVATYDGHRRNPVRLSSAVWDSLPRAGDRGARALMVDRPELVEEVPCEGEPADIDTREDLLTWS